jgi:hypothetical protein
VNIDGDGVMFFVEHQPRTLVRSFPFFNQYAPNAVVQGIVLSASTNRVVLTNAYDVTNNRIYENPVTIEAPNINTFTNQNEPAAPKDLVAYGINNASVFPIAIEGRNYLEDSSAPILYGGQEVSKIIWQCPGWTFNISDVYLEHPLAGSLTWYSVYNYEYHEHEVIGADFGTIEYPVQSPSSSYQNIGPLSAPAYAKVTCKSKATLEEVKEYIKRVPLLAYLVVDDVDAFESPLVDRLARDWIRKYQYVTFYVTLTQELSTMDLMYSSTSRFNAHAIGMGMHPDILPEFFIRYVYQGDLFTYEEATTLPWTFTNGGTRTISGPPAGTTNYPLLYEQVVAQLGRGYQQAFAELSTNVSLEFA